MLHTSKPASRSATDQKLEKTTKKSSTLEFKGVTRIPAKYSPFVRAAASLRWWKESRRRAPRETWALYRSAWRCASHINVSPLSARREKPAGQVSGRVAGGRRGGWGVREGGHSGYNIISRVGVVKKGGGAADPRPIFLSLFRSIFSLPFAPARDLSTASALPRLDSEASNSDRVQDDRGRWGKREKDTILSLCLSHLYSSHCPFLSIASRFSLSSSLSFSLSLSFFLSVSPVRRWRYSSFSRNSRSAPDKYGILERAEGGERGGGREAEGPSQW